MEYDSLIDLLEERGLIDDEGTRIELKKARNGLPDTFWNSVTAFLNTAGGYILLGFDDESKEPVDGLDIDTLQKNIAAGIVQRLSPAIAPTIEVLKVAGIKVILVNVPPADIHQKPVYFLDKVGGRKALKRVGSSNLQMTPDDIERCIIDKSGRAPDNYILQGYGMRHLNADVLSRFRQRLFNLKPTSRLISADDEGLLSGLGCATFNPEKDTWELNRAALLIFGKDEYVRSVFPALEVQILRFDEPDWQLTSENRGRKTVLEGRALFDFVPDLEETLNLLFPPTISVTAGKIGREPDLIYKALREAIVNALVHQDFLARRYIQIRIYTDRLEIENPGYSRKPVEIFNRPGSDPRNPIVASVFEEVDYVEKQGWGGSIMIKSMEQAGFATPLFTSDVDKNSFTVTFLWQHFMSQEDLDWVSKFGEMQEDEKKVLMYAKNNSEVKNADVRRLCRYDTLKASTILQRLKNKQLLELHGTGNQIYYTLIIPQASATLSTAEIYAPTLPLPAQGAHQASLFDDVTPSSKTLDELPVATSKTLDHSPMHTSKTLDDTTDVSIPRPTRRIQIEAKILDLAADFISLVELATALKLTPEAVRTSYISPMLADGRLEMRYPAQPKKRGQAYRRKAQ